MKRRRVALSLAVVASAAACLRPPLRASRAPSSNCSPARAARPVRRPTSSPANSRGTLADGDEPRRSTTGIISAGRTRSRCRATPSGSAPMRRRAAIARSTRRRSSSTARRMCSAATRTRSSSAIAQTREQAGTLSLPVSVSVAGEQIGVGAGRKGRRRQRRGLAVPDHQGRCRSRSAAARTRAARSPITTSSGSWIKLGEWTGAARTFTRADAGRNGGGADEVAVVVQSGSKEAPGPMLGATVAALH